MPIMGNYWLVKQEPSDYSWSDFVSEGGCMWDGVRNYQARNHLRSMHQGDFVLFYHSVREKQIVGVAQVAKEAYPDPTATEGDWSVVDLKPIKALARPVALSQIKQDSVLSDMALVRQSRLSVSPVTEEQFRRVLALGETTL